MIDERRFRLPSWDPGAGNDRSAVYAAVRIRLIICHPHGLTLGAHRHSQKNRLTVSVRSDHIWDAGPFADVAMLLQQFALAICCWSRLSFEFCNRRRYHAGRENVALGDVYDG